MTNLSRSINVLLPNLIGKDPPRNEIHLRADHLCDELHYNLQLEETLPICLFWEHNGSLGTRDRRKTDTQ